MKLLSTEIGDGWIELTYADNPDTDDASKLLIWRLPIEAKDSSSVALNRFVALKQLQEFIRGEIQNRYAVMRRQLARGPLMLLLPIGWQRYVI